MIIAMISGATRVIGKSQGFLGLPVRDTTVHERVTGPGTPCMETAWEPTPDELAALNAGAKVIVRIIGVAHPPLLVEVGEQPE